MVKFEPLKDFVVVERAITSKALVMPDSSEPTCDEIFRVISVGPGDEEHPQFLKVGDLICLVGYINTLTYKGTKVILARARDVMSIVKEL